MIVFVCMFDMFTPVPNLDRTSYQCLLAYFETVRVHRGIPRLSLLWVDFFVSLRFILRSSCYLEGC